MDYRDLGRTGLKVSAVGLGCAQLGSSNTEYATQIVRRAVELGITYFDTARGYWDSEKKIGLALEGQRSRAIVSSKTGGKTRDDAWRDVNESLERLRTDYIDNYHLHGLSGSADIAQRMGPGGSLEALIEAKRQGMIRHIGATSHRAEYLVEAIGRFDLGVVLVPMNIVEREPLNELIPICRQKGIGVTIMKPLGTGLLPAPLALKWLVNQPIASAVPGITAIEQLEECARVGHDDQTITPAEASEIMGLKAKLDNVRCRVCGFCEPCPQNIKIAEILGTDVMYDHYRTMGRAQFRSFPWSRLMVEEDLPLREAHIGAIESCTNCGECEAKCRYGLPIRQMLPATLPTMYDVVEIYRQRLADSGESGLSA